MTALLPNGRSRGKVPHCLIPGDHAQVVGGRPGSGRVGVVVTHHPYEGGVRLRLLGDPPGAMTEPLGYDAVRHVRPEDVPHG